MAVVGVVGVGFLSLAALAAGADPAASSSSTSAAPPKPVPPVYERVKDLHLATPFVAAGQPAVTIVVPESGLYGATGSAIQKTVSDLTGVQVPIVTDADPAAAVPLCGHLVVLGNRSTNRALGALYDRFFTLVDLKYPGPGGHVVQSVHSPFGDGKNVIVVGGSDTSGVASAGAVLIEKLKGAGATKGDLAVGWTMDIKLGEGVVAPTELKDVKIWEESVTYGSSGYFGWNIISKRMALYAMTGDESHAREFLRLAFPDAAAVKEIEAADGERIENKHEPLSGPYHYSAHMMILLWDLIEESPFFTDADRLRITNAFSKQLTHRAAEGVYGIKSHHGFVGNRHADWAATSLYCLARYFQRDYPDPIWECALDSVRTYYSSLRDSAWLAGNNDHLFWYTSYYDPILDYVILSGDRTGLETGNLQAGLRTQDVLFTGSARDWGLKASSLNFLLRTAYLTGDGRWLFYRDRTGIDTNVFRLGQSFWPDEKLEVRPPAELLDTWTIQPMPLPMWKTRASGIPIEQSFLWGSYRTSLDASGDFLLIKGHNGAGRNPYHTFGLLEMRLAGSTLLAGYHNQVLTRADGLVEPQVAMDAALLCADVIGDTAIAVGEVPKTPYANWRRTVVQRSGQYVLIADDLGFRSDTENMRVVTEWQPVGGQWDAAANVLRIKGSAAVGSPPGWRILPALKSALTCGPGKPEELLSRLQDLNIVLLKAQEPGAWLEMPFELDAPLAGEVFADVLNYRDRGTLRVSLDGVPFPDDFDHYAPTAQSVRIPLGRKELGIGWHVLRIEVVGKKPESERLYAGVSGVSIRPDGVLGDGGPGGYALHPSERMTGSGKDVVTLEWLGAAKPGQHRVFFHLLQPAANSEAGQSACLSVSENAAILTLPQLALAVVGTDAGTRADFALVGAQRLVGHAVLSLDVGGPLMTADEPVDVNWDFTAGVLSAVVGRETRMALALENAEGVAVDGAPLQVAKAHRGLNAFTLAPGRHTLTGVKPGAKAMQSLSLRLSALLAQGLARRELAPASATQVQAAVVAPMKEVLAATAEGIPGQTLVIPGDAGDLLCIAAGKTIQVFGADGTEIRKLETDGQVRVLTWWPEHKLLLAGCADEKLIAFDEKGVRQWVFVSEMDRAVWEAAKQYWFKSAHPGIYGLGTGVFIDGKSQCFVGSACTLEIVDEKGQLVKRLPVFWGPGRNFAAIDGPDGSRRLLIGRQPNDSHALAIVDSKNPSTVGRGFDGVPSGHTYVAGWDCMSRNHIFCEDMDGDGKPEVVSEINGSWCRVTVWGQDGKALSNAQFGPGAASHAKNVLDLDIADLEGDGKKEIVAALRDGLVVALDHTCGKLWSRRMPAAPVLLKCFAGKDVAVPVVVVGCQDGTVWTLDAKGAPVRQARLNGAPVSISAFRGAAGPGVLLATDKGQVKGFSVAE
ncbi:MAG: hypothetical protein A3K19_12065 [Lentisphaerae bacterium RIFOXYB12_FULL_65_16]|nr:MAG: hypothetical protein A3K18_14460 [Lentisphaerae bacterium RIFOXYA12_64_32]OGV86212.1 MAG: hypothetical protein A3K19_12065 [Lentisphaerae bacterium RIFOXYB12_FULL_65_16]